MLTSFLFYVEQTLPFNISLKLLSTLLKPVQYSYNSCLLVDTISFGACLLTTLTVLHFLPLSCSLEYPTYSLIMSVCLHGACYLRLSSTQQAQTSFLIVS